MNDIPLVKDNGINAINTSLIAAKKSLQLVYSTLDNVNKTFKDINKEIDAIDAKFADYLLKDDVVNSITDNDMRPVTSNAVAQIAPVDTVASGNLHSVTSNAVANWVMPVYFNIDCSIKGKIRLTKIGKLVIAQYYENDNRTFTPTTEQQWVPIATIPEGFRPKYGIYFSEDGSNGDIGKYQIYQNGGEILFYRFYNQTYGWETAFNVMWVTN